VLTTACHFNKASEPVVKNQDVVPTKEDEIYKYNAYIDLNNFIVKEFAETLEDYFDELGNDPEPSFKKNFSFRPRAISKYDKEKLEKAFVVAAQQPQYMSVDGALQELYPTMTELMNLLTEAHSYYELKNYVDDDYVKAKELHKKIVDCYKIYQPLAKKYCNALNVIAIEREKSSLENYKNNGQMLRYHCLRVLTRAEELQQELDDQQITAANILDIDVAKFMDKYNLLIEDVNEIMKYSKDEEQGKKEGITNFDPYKTYIGDIVQVKVAATQLKERVQNKKSFKTYQLRSKFFMESQDGAPEKFSRKLSDALRSYNRLK
jgi:hypothetical protein